MMIPETAHAAVRSILQASVGAGARAVAPPPRLVLQAASYTLLQTPLPGGTPDSAGWYHLAYTVAAVAYAGYAVSLWWRRRCLRTGA